MPKTIQELLAERRATVKEQMHERDLITRAVLQYQIDELEREIVARLPSAKAGIS